MAFEDEELAGYEKQMIMLQNTYPVIPDNVNEAAKQAIWFLNGGKESDDKNSISLMRLYSFAKDASFIFAAFRQTHGIDLQKTKMHWFEFLALFMDLGSETTFSNLIGLRKRVKNGNASKEDRKAAREMGEMFDIPDYDDRTLEEKEKEVEFLKLMEGR